MTPSIAQLRVTRVGATATEAILEDLRARKAGLVTAVASSRADTSGY